jgi:hypothetical protein
VLSFPFSIHVWLDLLGTKTVQLVSDSTVTCRGSPQGQLPDELQVRTAMARALRAEDIDSLAALLAEVLEARRQAAEFETVGSQ